MQRSNTNYEKSICFLQGPICPFFFLLAKKLANKYKVYKINLSLADQIMWKFNETINYKGSFSDWGNFINDFFLKNRITDIILLGENRPYHQEAIKYAKELNINIIVTDYGYIRPDWITLELDGMSGNSLFPKQLEAITTIAPIIDNNINYSKHYTDSFFNMVIWDMTYNLINFTISKIFYPYYKSHLGYHPLLSYLGTGYHLLRTKFDNKKSDRLVKSLIKNDQEYFLFPLQMRFDYQIRAYSKYHDLIDAIDEVIASFSQFSTPNSKLIIKEHPLDENIINWRKQCLIISKKYGIESRIIIINGGNLDTMIKHCCGIVTINSTVGVLGLKYYKPVCVLGQAIYDIKNLTYQEGINNFWTSKFRPDKQIIDNFIKTLASTVHIRGVYYKQPGLDNAVNEAYYRIINNKVNKPIKFNKN